MKKYISVILILTYAVLFTACNQNVVPSAPAVPPSVSSGSSDEVSNTNQAPFVNKQPYKLTVNEYQTSIKYICYQPPVIDGKILVANQENYIDRDNALTILYDIKSGEETNIDIFAQDPKLYNGYVYYAYHDVGVNADGVFNVGSDDQKRLIKYNIENGDKSIIYETQGNETVIAPTMQISDNFLTWHEFSADAEQILSEDGEMVGIYGETVIFDLETEKVIYRAENTITFSPYFAPYLCNDGMIILTVKDDKGYNLKLVDFINGETTYEKNVDEIPLCIEYDNQRFAYLIRGVGIDVFNTFTDEKINSLKVDLSTGDFTEMRILDGRFMIYGKAMEVFVVDLNSGETIYSGYDNNPNYDDGGDYLYRYIHNGHFTIDRKSKQVLYRRMDRAMERAATVVVLSFT